MPSKMPMHPLHYATGRQPWHSNRWPGAHRHFDAVVYPGIHGWTRGGGVDVYIKTWFDLSGDHPRNPTGNPGGWWERYHVDGLKARFAFQDLALHYGGYFVDQGWFDDLRPHDMPHDEGKAQGKGKASGIAHKGKDKGDAKGKDKGLVKGKSKGKGDAKGKDKGKAKSKGKGKDPKSPGTGDFSSSASSC